jgi:hypothetical protein
MKSILDPTYLPYTLLTFLLIEGIYTGKISKLGWLIRSVKYVMWADALNFLYQLLISIFKIMSPFQSNQPILQKHFGPV